MFLFHLQIILPYGAIVLEVFVTIPIKSKAGYCLLFHFKTFFSEKICQKGNKGQKI